MLRFGIVLGRDGGLFPVLDRAARLGLGAVMGAGRQASPWVHLDDAVGLILHAIQDGRMRGPVNAVSPECLAQAGFMQALAGGLRAGLGEMAELFLSGQHAAPARALAAGYAFAAPTLGAALDRLLGVDGVRAARPPAAAPIGHPNAA